MAGKHISETELRKIGALVKAGKSDHEVSIELGILQSRVGRARLKLGIRRRRPSKDQSKTQDQQVSITIHSQPTEPVVFYTTRATARAVLGILVGV